MFYLLLVSAAAGLRHIVLKEKAPKLHSMKAIQEPLYKRDNH
jgi:hypothetical protein